MTTIREIDERRHLVFSEMQDEIHTNKQATGWLDDEDSFAVAMASMHGEVSEAWEAWRKWGLDDATKTFEPGSVGERDTLFYPPRPEGIGSEFADLLIRLLGDCDRFGVDLVAEYERKMRYNRTRPHRHGNKRA